MIQELSVKDFAIISKLNLQFKEGMTVLTGETGAGKSIIIDAMGLLVGGRGSIDFIREGAEKCRIEGAFHINQNLRSIQQHLVELGIELPDETLILQREIFKSGRNSCRINGQLVNTKILREVGRRLVDIHGQNEHQELMDPTQHLMLLDKFDENRIQPALKKYQMTFEEYQKLREKIETYQTHEKEFAQRMDMLRFQYAEISSADLEVGEEEALLEERGKLINYQRIVQALSNSYGILEGDEEQVLNVLGIAMNELETIEDLDKEYQEASELVKTAYFNLQEVAGQLSGLLDQLELDETRLVAIEERLDTIRQLKRKYGETVAEVLAYLDIIEKELNLTENQTEDLETLEKEFSRLTEQLTQESQMLTYLREEVAQTLETQILLQLKGLYMDKTQFKVVFEKSKADFRLLGQDRIEFYISTNVGESLKPLVKVASGGELSRIMLALKTIFSQSQAITSIIFDEVDTGVSGRVAQAIAEKIHQIGLNSQVLCISHLPQVAAVADTQYYIEKKVKEDRTETSVRELSFEERTQEVARMLSGSEITELTLEHARELLELAHGE